MVSMKSTYRNRLDMLTLGGGVLVFVAAIIYALLISGSLKAIALASLLGGIFLLGSAYGTLGRTPRIVRMENGEIIMFSYFGTVRRINFKDIEYSESTLLIRHNA